MKRLFDSTVRGQHNRNDNQDRVTLTSRLIELLYEEASRSSWFLPSSFQTTYFLSYPKSLGGERININNKNNNEKDSNFNFFTISFHWLSLLLELEEEEPPSQVDKSSSSSVDKKET